MSAQPRTKTSTIRAHHREEFEFRLMMVLAFVVFLPVALVMRLLPRRIRPSGSLGGERGSFIRAAWEAAAIAVGASFMA